MQINNHNEIQLYTYKDGYYLKKERKGNNNCWCGYENIRSNLWALLVGM